MAEFLRSTGIKSTRKVHKCFACGEVIDKGSKAVEWVSVGNGSVNSEYLHPACWDVTENHCFSCKGCDDGEGFNEGYLYESMNGGSGCEGVDQWYPFYLTIIKD